MPEPTRDQIDAEKQRLREARAHRDAVAQARAARVVAQRELAQEQQPPPQPVRRRPVYLDEWVTETYQNSLKGQ